MASSVFVLTPYEHAALRRLLLAYPHEAAAFGEEVASLVDSLTRTFQWLITTERQAGDLLVGLLDRVVAKTFPETDEWDELDELRCYGVDLVARHLLAKARDGLHLRYLVPKWN